MSTRSLETVSENSNRDRVVFTSSKAVQKPKASLNKSLQPILNGNEGVFSLNYVEKELDCQICLSALDSPVLLPCNSHSLCLACVTSLFKHQKRNKDGSRSLFCPSCGVSSGMTKVKKVEKLKVNRELERVQRAYEKEKALWVDEKVQLETQINLIKNSQMEENTLKTDDSKKKTNKKGMTSDEVKHLKLMLEDFGSEKLKEAQLLILESIKAKEKVLSTPTKKSTRKGREKSIEDVDSQKTTPSKSGSHRKRSSSQKGMWDFVEKTAKSKNHLVKRENTVAVATLEKKEYPLRNLKRTRTVQL